MASDSSKFVTLATFVERLYASDIWGRLAEQGYDLPRKECFTAILEEVFWTSMESEEGRLIEFAVAIRAGGEGSGGMCIDLLKPRPATVQEFRRLAPATDPQNTLIQVSPVAGEQAGEITGLIRVGLSVDGGDDYPQCIVIKIDGPGQFHLQAGTRRIVWYNKGMLRFPFQRAGLESFNDLISLRRWLTELFHELGDENFPEHNPFFIAVYVDALVRILDRVEDLRHGGAVIVTPKGKSLADMRLKARYEFGRRTHILRDAVIEAQRQGFRYRTALLSDPDGASQEAFNDATSRIANLTRFVGDLTGSDGAVVLDTDLSILGAGVQLPSDIRDSEGEDVEEIEHIDAERLVHLMAGNEEHVDSRPVDEVGMRHRSVFSFILQEPEAVAFVISRDGGTSIVCRPQSELPGPEGNPAYREHGKVLVVRGARLWASFKIEG